MFTMVKYFAFVLYALYAFTEVSSGAMEKQYFIGYARPPYQHVLLYATRYTSKVCLIAQDGQDKLPICGSYILVGPDSTSPPLFANYIYLGIDMSESTFEKAIRDAGYNPQEIN
ncbi:MAG: hypothetical protein CBE41_02380 [Gammaproteobacteria bacterium TMED281]|nr:MAG: hypothetical protein CBE41_02380 [Gammaproteobacteria bacterium TMED281]|tara:strand:- start:517 stop:858 length:342 start_codon:yes stop_codon:yes gene_type:complete